jgi:cytochrome c oxidase subunit 2
MRLRRLAPAALACVVSACVRYEGQSALNPSGPEASSIRGLFFFMIAVAVVVYILVIGTFLLIVRRRPDQSAPMDPAREATAKRRIQLAVAVAVPVMFVMLVYDFAVGRGIGGMPTSPMMTITVTGHQWWWQVDYEDPTPSNQFRTANEIHIPVGRPVVVKLVSHDVIHSFWIPNLGGKKDLIPGHHNQLILRADKPGIYRGQCAEFCGIEHAMMAMMVIAEPPEQFAEWVERQRAPPPPVTDALALHGREVFEGGTCAMCHTVASTRAMGGVGPTLTHVASRRTIAAGSLNNTPDNLLAWITDPQAIKPGADMPPSMLSGPDLQALVAYLRTLR